MPEVYDKVQHGIDDDPTNDAEKGATLGGIGGAVTGAVAGAMAGPVGAVVGAVVGGIAGAGLSGAAVGVVDRIDNDNNISGVGDGVNYDDNRAVVDPTLTDSNYRDPNNLGHVSRTNTGATPIIDNGIPGVQTGGRAVDGTMDTRGIWEKTADTLTGDHIDDKTGKPVAKNPIVDARPAPVIDNGIPGVQTGGRAVDGTPDTRGIMEKTADTLTGDNIDDKTGKRVN